MNTNPEKTQTKSRILKDLKEVNTCNLPGISQAYNDPESIFKIYANIQIQEGIYKGLLVPILIQLPSNYPMAPPAAYVIKGHPFTRRFHEHIIGGNSGHDYSICTDMTSNFQSYFHAEKGSGWNPAYSIKSLLLQLQVFFARPDLPKDQMPTAKEIKQMLEAGKQFQHAIPVIDDKNRISEVLSTYDKPFPELEMLPEEANEEEDHEKNENDDSGIKSHEEEKKTEEPKPSTPETEEERLESKRLRLKYEIEGKLICPIKKVTYDEEEQGGTSPFGYPILVEKDKYGRFVITPRIELMTYEGFLCLENKSIFGEEINKLIPLYLNAEYFNKACKTISEKWNPGDGRSDFMDPFVVTSFYPSVISNTVILFLQGTVHESYAAIDAYCQLRHTLKHFLEMRPQIKELIDSDVKDFIKDKSKRTKQACGMLGEVYVKASLSSTGLMDKDLRLALFHESCARQIPWMVRDDPGAFLEDERTPDLLERFCKHNITSKQFSILQYETARLFMDPQVILEQEERHGFITEERVKTFRETLMKVKDGVGNWKSVLAALDLLEVIPDEKALHKLLVQAYLDAKEHYGNEFPVKPQPVVRISRKDFGTEMKKEEETGDKYFRKTGGVEKGPPKFFRSGKKE